MVTVIQSFALLGLEVHPVSCEVDLAPQLPAFSLVGLPSSLTQESRERVRAAIVNSGFEWPARKVTVNLLPADLPKWGCHFELAMALGILSASGMAAPCAPNVVAIGELSLSGLVRPCGWLAAAADWLSSAARATRERFEEPLVVVAHEEDLRRLRAVAPRLPELCELASVSDLTEAREVVVELSRRGVRPSTAAFSQEWLGRRSSGGLPRRRLGTLEAVEGEPLATAAALVAIAGGYHCLFAGPQGAGKSMLVRAICEATTGPSEGDRAERASLLSTFGESFGADPSTGDGFVVRLQTSISRAALEGALLTSGQVLPGELTRAHRGILVADELLEFKRDVIEAFRQPLDERVVRLQRAKFRTLLPASFQLLATTNLCPCGEFGIAGADCRCSHTLRSDYQRKLSGPLVDRFDLVVLVGGERRARRFKTDLPLDIAGLVAELNRREHWEERLERATAPAEASAVATPADPAELWAEVSCDASPRGRLKIARVAGTIARLLGEPKSSAHLRLGVVLRSEVRRLLKNERLVI